MLYIFFSFLVCVLLLLSDFNMLDCVCCRPIRGMLVAQVGLCHLFWKK